MAKRVKIPTTDDAELRRWCIEQAIRWPTESRYGQGGAAGAPIQEHNIIDRADRLLKWVTKT